MARLLFGMLIGMLTGGAAVGAAFYFTLGPRQDDFKVRAAGYYAQQMSHFGVGALASYHDCNLELPDTFQRLRGIQWIGECTTSARGTGYVYSVHLDTWARNQGDELRVLPP